MYDIGQLCLKNKARDIVINYPTLNRRFVHTLLSKGDAEHDSSTSEPPMLYNCLINTSKIIQNDTF